MQLSASRLATSFAFITLCCAGFSHGQKESPAEQIRNARASYYTPTANGLRKFHCTASSDWKTTIARITGGEVADDNPFLVYLNSVHMSADDEVHGEGHLQWATTSAPPDELAKPVGQFRDAIVQMFDGFFQTWNGFMNGSMVPDPDEQTTITRVGKSLSLHATDDDDVVDENFDEHILLTDAHVSGPTMDVMMYPAYDQTSDGRVLSSVRATYRAPPSAPPTELTMSFTYTMVSGYRLPATIRVDEKNVGVFEFSLSNCTVNKF